jgi:hypothetical protein
MTMTIPAWFGAATLAVAMCWVMTWEWLTPSGPRTAADRAGRGFRATLRRKFDASN